MDFGEYSDGIRKWTNEVLASRGVDAEQTLKSCNEIISYGVQTKDSKLLGFAYFYAGETYYCLNDHENFFQCITQAVSYLDTAQEWELLVKAYNFLGIVACNRGNLLISLDYYMSAVHYCRKYHMDQAESIINANIGSLNLLSGRYAEAQSYLERALAYFRNNPQDENYHSFMLCIYGNLIKALTLQKKLDEVPQLLDHIYRDHWQYAEDLDKLSVWCAEAIYYHARHDEGKRNQCIASIQEKTSDHLTVMDIFADYYDYCEMLLDTDKDEAFWQILDILEPLIRNSNLSNLQLKIISLKVKYYRIHKQNAEYLQAAGLYFELSQLQEKEVQKMMNSVFQMRRNLEMANQRRQEMELQNKRLLEKSQKDPLTGLSNRYRFNDYSEEAFQKACMNHTSLTFEILDIDFFKEYNDNYGHQKGDECLIKVSQAIRRLAERHGAFCSRYGGDEFVLIYENLTRAEAEECAAELKRDIMSLQLEHKYSKADPFVTISQGLCWDIPTSVSRIWDYIHSADIMLYQVKEQRRNYYRIGGLDAVYKKKDGNNS